MFSRNKVEIYFKDDYSKSLKLFLCILGIPSSDGASGRVLVCVIERWWRNLKNL